jgi:hypothetical protein
MHSYEYVSTRFERGRRDGKLFDRVDRPAAEGEVRAAEKLVNVTREELEFCETAVYRRGVEGDDPVEVMADNSYLDMRRNMAIEAAIRAEGFLTLARARLADYERAIAAQKAAA